MIPTHLSLTLALLSVPPATALLWQAAGSVFLSDWVAWLRWTAAPAAGRAVR